MRSKVKRISIPNTQGDSLKVADTVYLKSSYKGRSEKDRRTVRVLICAPIEPEKRSTRFPKLAAELVEAESVTSLTEITNTRSNANRLAQIQE